MADVSVATTDGVSVITMDDGKANAFSYAMMAALTDAYDQAIADDAVGAIVLAGREGKFCAGFDLGVMKEGMGQAIDMVCTGGDLLMKIFLSPKPVIAAATGHALAGGALTLLCCDYRVGATGPFKVGLNETAIGMVLPEWACVLASHRIPTTHLARRTMGAYFADATEAVPAGFLDEAVAPDQVLTAAISEAARWAALDAGAVRGTRKFIRQATADTMMSLIAEDRATAAKLLAKA